MKNIFLIIVLILGVKALGQGQTRKVLFLGNSYTYVNNLPQMISQIAMSAGDILVFDSHSIGGYTLEDHYNSPTSLNKILSDDWDYIVLQEQSQRPAFIIPDGFMHGFGNLKNYIKLNKPCAQITSFMTWGYQNGDPQNCPINPAVCTYEGMQNLITDRYMEMSDMFESEVTPVGVVWKYIRENYPNINLYQSDGSHPSVAGSYLAACSFYTSIFRKNPLLISNNLGLDTNTASIIKNATKSLVFDQMLEWYIGKYIPNSNFNYIIGTGSNEIIINIHPQTYRDSFSWDFGDGTTSTMLTPTHNYTDDGTYTIKLTSYKCYLGENIESIFTRTVNFCTHTNTIYPTNLMLCPGETDTLWTQPADSYQWYDELGNPIPGATNQSLEVVSPGAYSVLTTVDGCSEMSPAVFVDTLVVIGDPDWDCGLGVIDNKDIEVNIFPNPVKNLLNIQTKNPIREISVYDLIGKKITVNQISPDEYDVTGLLQGIYFLKISMESGQHISAKFIKQ